MNFQEFLSKQQKVYDSLRDPSKLAELTEQGISPDFEPHKGYIISFRHSPQVNRKVSDFSRQASGLVGAVVYEEECVHTSLAGFRISLEEEIDFYSLHIFARNIHSTKNRFSARNPRVDYRRWLCGKDTVIAEGYPNQDFYSVAMELFLSAQKSGVRWRMPWGVHITASRFTEKQSPDQTRGLIELVQTAPPIGISRPQAIEVGYFVMTAERFDYQTYERFELRH